MLDINDAELMIAYRKTNDIEAVGLHYDLTPSEMRELEDLISIEENEQSKQYERNKVAAKVRLPASCTRITGSCVTVNGYTYPVQYGLLGMLDLHTDGEEVVAIIYAEPCKKTGNIPGIRASQIIWIEEKNKYE